MKPLIVHFSIYQFLSPKAGRMFFCCLSQLVSYFEIDAEELFEMYLPYKNEGAENTLVISTDRGETFEERTAQWIVKNIASYESGDVFVPARWVNNIIRLFKDSLSRQSSDILQVIAKNGAFALRSNSPTLLNTYHKLLMDYVQQSTDMKSHLLVAKEHQGHRYPVEYCLVFWDQRLFKNPRTIVSYVDLVDPFKQIQQNGPIRYCLEKI